MAQTLKAPFQSGMDLGMGFNSYTQSTCLGRAVTIKRSVAENKPEIPQQVSYRRDTVDKLSQVTSKLNIAGTVAIKAGIFTGSGAGSYVDETAFSESDLNFLIQVDVQNQHPEPDPPEEQFNLLANVTPGNFDSIYGDTYIHDFEEGGVFQAVVSMKILDESSKKDIQVKADVAFAGIGSSVSATGDVKVAKETLNKSTSMTINAFWRGGGQVKKSDASWTVDELIAVGSRFPDLCAQTPSKTYAVLKKYVHLASFQTQVPQISPMSYENAALYTDILLDAFLRYRQLYQQLTDTIEGIQKHTVEFDKDAPPPEADSPFAASLTGKGGLLDARQDLLAQTAAINVVVDDIAADPQIIKTFTPDRPPRYMDPIRWELRLPATRRIAVPPPPAVLDPKITLRGKPAVMALPTGQHEAFAQGADGLLWHKLTTPGTSEAQDAEVWDFHGDGIPLNSTCSPVCAAAAPSANKPDGPDQPDKYCFVVGADGRLYYKKSTAVSPKEGVKWSTLQVLGVAKGIRFNGGLAACSRGDRVHLAALAVDGAVYWTSVAREHEGGEPAWTSLSRLGGGPSLRGVPTLVINGADNSLSLIAIDSDSRLQANTLPPDSSAWTGWKTSAGSWVNNDEISAAWPAHPAGKTDVDVMVVGDGRNRVWQAQLVGDTWRDGADDFNLNKCQGPVAITSMGTEHEEFFVIAEQGALWQTSYIQAANVDAHNSWKKVDNGPFRPVLPVVVPLVGSDFAVYVVNAVDGKLVRFVSSGGKLGGAERV